MKANRVHLALLFISLSAILQLPAQQSEADRKLLAEIRAKAEKGDALSQAQLGAAFLVGASGVAKDEGEAVKWFRKGTEQSYAAAQYNLGHCYAKALGVAKDEVEAVKWFRKAAGQNVGEAQATLGQSYFYGRGVVRDEVEAVKWYRKAAEQNHATAQNDLGSCYFNGQGVAKDHVEAYKWALLAAAQGHENAKRNVTGLENEMSRDQIAQGQKLASDFKPRDPPQSGVSIFDESPAD